MTSTLQNNDDLYVLGGMNGIELNSVSRFNSLTREWTLMHSTTMPRKLSHFGCSVVDKNIYICGGHDGDRASNELIVFETNTNHWQFLAPMRYARYSCAMAVLGGYIYVIDGHDTDDRLAVVERYSIETNEWERVQSMGLKRDGVGLVEMNGFLYAIGGRGSGTSLSIVERYDPQMNEWSPMARMNNPFPVSGCVVFNCRIYALGKGNFEGYCPVEDKWYQIPTPTECEFGKRLAVFDGKLLAIGGSVGKIAHLRGTTTVEYFDFEARSWIKVDDMNIARCFHGLAVVQNG